MNNQEEKHIRNIDFDMTPCDEINDIDRRPEYEKLKLTSSQKIQIGGLIQQMPGVAAAEALSKAYVVKFPKGLPSSCELMKYKTGGLGTSIIGEKGIVAHASLHELSAQASVLGALNAMSIVSGQYFLAQINNELKTMNQNIDKILEFLYGDKKAELMAEVSFVKYAYQNFSSIMSHEQQRLATIVSLQEARKIAMKDIEFYMSDLDSVVNAKSGSDILSLNNKAYQIKECLELSIQLYSMSSLLEIYYSQNFDSSYIYRVEEDAVTYIGKCEKRILSCFSKLVTHIQNIKEIPLRKVDKPALEEKAALVIDTFSKGTESDMIKSIRSVLHASEAETEYYIENSGELYLKRA